jgi:hypothetical protein
MVLSPRSPRRGPVTSAAEAQTLIKQAARRPAVARPHESIDLDTTRGELEIRRTTRQRLSSAQRNNLQAVYFIHLKELYEWRTERRVVMRRTASGEVTAHWEPSWPKIDWQRIAHSSTVGIHASVGQMKHYLRKFGKKLRAEIRAGQRPGLPVWAVRHTSLPAALALCTDQPLRICPDGLALTICLVERCAGDESREVDGTSSA